MIRRAVFFLIAFSFLLCTLTSSASDTLSEKIELPKEAVFKKVFENGLTVLVKPSPPKDLVAINIMIKSGLNYEAGYTGSGISHFVEHMVFKGTVARPVGAIEKEMKSYGGFLNGSVSQDMTSFHVTVPARYFANTMSVVEDMLLNATFENEEFEKEKEVILKEINLNKDEPQSQLTRLLYENAFINHPYKYPVIGYEKNLKALLRDDLIRYYNRTYAPNRIVIGIVGDIDKDEAFSTVEKTFKNFRQADYSVDIQAAEPLQIGEKRAEKEYPITLSYLAIGFHSTSILDKDLFAMDVLSIVLGRSDNSRLNVGLFKDKKVVYSISASNYTPKDAGLFVINAVLDKGNLEAAEKATLYEIQRLKQDSVTDEELESAKRMVLSDFIFSRETIEEQASDISSNEVLAGNYDFSRRYIDGIQAVSKEDLKRVADKYLTDDNRTVVMLVPRSVKTTGTEPAKASAVKDTIKKKVLPNGLRILLREDKKTPTISISVAILGGLAVENNANNGISNLTARMLLKGTNTREESRIKGAIENLGGAIGTFSGYNTFGVNLTLLKGDVDYALEILKDILTNSVFPQGPLDREKALTLAMIRDEEDDIFQKGSYTLKKSLFKNHPYGLRPIGEKESINSLKREDLLNFYETYCAPNNMVVSISGDIDTESLTKKIEEIFSSMKRKEIPVIPIKEVKIDKVESQTLEMDKEESLILIGFETISLNNPDRYALDILSSIMSGASGRLFSSVRDKLSLAYTLGCVERRGIDAGYLIFYAATTKDKLKECEKAILGEIKNIISRTVEDEELLFAKRELYNGLKINMQTNGFFSWQSALDELCGLGYDDIYKYEKEIEKVTKEDIKRAADKYLKLDSYAEVIIHPR